MRIQNVSGTTALLVLLCCFGARFASGQSLDITAPSAVLTSEVTGAISARDIGDSRLTDHFFAFTGTPGDLLITVDSRNLNGDIDVFTLTGMRPLMKFSVYAGSSTPTTKSIYLRKREDLILRIEARTPNDDEGIYRLRFGGSFEPVAGRSQAEAEGGRIAGTEELRAVDAAAPGVNSGKKGRRVSSVGARVDEPATTEVAAVATPEPAEKPATEVTVPKARTRNVRGRTRPPASARTRPPTAEKSTGEKPVAETKEDPAAVNEGESKTTPEGSATEAKTTTARKRTGKKSTTARAVEKPEPPPEPESGPRLIIETSDGTLINRYMTSVRRVTVENGQVVVVARDGKVQRIPLTNVVRMTIAP